MSGPPFIIASASYPPPFVVVTAVFPAHVNLEALGYAVS